MSTLRFEVETISPMFLRGADGDTPELRPPSFKGMLRYWWRAAKVLPVPELHALESQVFGGASGNEGQRSTVTIRLRHDAFTTGQHKPVPHRGFRLEAFDPGQRLEIILQRMPHCPVPLSEIRNAMFVALQLGGVGFRSRRGFGSMRIRAINGEAYRPPEDPLKPVADALHAINDNFAYENNRGDEEIHYRGSTQPRYPWIRRVMRGFYFFDRPGQLLRGISQSTHDNDSNYTGSPNRPRFASPEYVSLQADRRDCWGVVTSLHVPPQTDQKLGHRDTRDRFREDVLWVGE